MFRLRQKCGQGRIRQAALQMFHYELHLFDIEKKYLYSKIQFEMFFEENNIYKHVRKAMISSGEFRILSI